MSDWKADQSQINPAWSEPYKAMAQADWDRAKAVLMTAANNDFESTGNKQQFDVMVLKVNNATRSECCTMARKVKL